MMLSRDEAILTQTLWVEVGGSSKGRPSLSIVFLLLFCRIVIEIIAYSYNNFLLLSSLIDGLQTSILSADPFPSPY